MNNFRDHISFLLICINFRPIAAIGQAKNKMDLLHMVCVVIKHNHFDVCCDIYANSSGLNLLNKLLTSTEDENFFFEFKADDETPAKLVKEVSAFSNTYGGYILFGINDDKTIGGCQKWTEQRIHTTKVKVRKRL
jgi:hypothetical protein